MTSKLILKQFSQKTIQYIFFKSSLVVFIILQIVPHISTDTKQLYEIHLRHPLGTERHEVAWLKNVGTPEEELVVMGNTTNLILQHGDQFYGEVTEYIADRNGYRSKFKIYQRSLNEKRLGAITLKSLSG